jgi:hypothetical protein
MKYSCKTLVCLLVFTTTQLLGQIPPQQLRPIPTNLDSILSSIKFLGSIVGRVTIEGTYTPLQATMVCLRERNDSVLTNANGEYAFHNLSAASYTLEFRAIGFEPKVRNAHVAGPKQTTLDVPLTPDYSLAGYHKTGGIVGVVVDSSDNEPVFFAEIIIQGMKTELHADLDGRFAIHDLPAGNYRLNVSAMGYKNLTLDSVVVTLGRATHLRIHLPQTQLLRPKEW